MAHHSNRMPTRFGIVASRQYAPQRRADTQQVEVIAGYKPDGQPFQRRVRTGEPAVPHYLHAFHRGDIGKYLILRLHGFEEGLRIKVAAVTVRKRVKDTR